MNLIVLVSLLIVGVSALIMRLRDVKQYAHVINILFLAVLTTVLISLDKSEEITPVYGLLGLAAINLLAAQWKSLHKPYLRGVIPAISLIVFFLIFKDGVVQLLGEKNAVVHKFTLLGGILSVLLFEFSFLKNYLLQKIKLTGTDVNSARIVELLFLGIALLFGSLGSGVFGVVIVAAGYTASSFYRSEDGDAAISSSLIALIGVYVLNFHVGGVSADLLKGDVLMGLFVGVFALKLFNFAMDGIKRTAVSLLTWIMILGIGAGIVYINKVAFEGMGGMDALIAFFFGLIIANVISGKRYSAVAIVSPLLAIALMLTQQSEEEKTEVANQIVKTDDVESEVEALKILDVSKLEGSFAIDSEQSVVNFHLGKEGETKGSFKKVSGSIVIDDLIEKSKLNIILSLEDFTTRNSFRDKSLMSDEYLDQKKFPEITYTSKSITPKGENTFEVVGDFKMLGVSKEVIVTMQQIESEKGNVLIGTGILDRTIFGMAPSSSEGNVVTFNYEVLLK